MRTVGGGHTRDRAGGGPGRDGGPGGSADGTEEPGIDRTNPDESRESGTPGGTPGETDSATDALERELTVLFRRARAYSGELARVVHPGLEPSAYGLLVRLSEAEPERATDLAAYFGVGKATMSRQLRALEDLGLVTREPDPADGRAYLMRLTDEGHARYARVRSARRDRYLRRLASWDPAEVAELSRLLHRFNELTE